MHMVEKILNIYSLYEIKWIYMWKKNLKEITYMNNTYAISEGEKK